MTSSASSSSSRRLALLALPVLLIGCVLGGPPAPSEPPVAPGAVDPGRIAVFPIYNLSASPAPVEAIRDSLIENLADRGLSILDEEILEKFIYGNRIRYSGGINAERTRALREETGADVVLLTILELYSEELPPKIALSSRLVSTADTPAIVWAGSRGIAGDDAPGILGLSRVDSALTLIGEATGQFAESLARHLAGRQPANREEAPEKRFEPWSYYRSPHLEPDRPRRMVVLPFNNVSERKYAGEIMQLHFIRELQRVGGFQIVEPGLTREILLAKRVFMKDGLSLANADAILDRLGAEILLTGSVLEYTDYKGETGKPKVDFSAQLIDGESRQVVWASKSFHQGDEGVYFFDFGKVNTAHAMAERMARGVVATIFE